MWTLRIRRRSSTSTCLFGKFSMLLSLGRILAEARFWKSPGVSACSPHCTGKNLSAAEVSYILLPLAM